MDDLGLWQRALTPDEINGIYQNGLQGSPLTQEFEPLNIRSIASEGGNVRLTYYNPFANREVVIQSADSIGAAWSNLDVTINDLGDSRLSLIDRVDIREMIHVVRAFGAFEDGLPDFLVNDIFDARDLPGAAGRQAECDRSGAAVQIEHIEWAVGAAEAG